MSKVEMLIALSLAVVLLAGFYFLALAVVALAAPARAAKFLMGFAGSAFTHYSELTVRLAVGTAFILQSASVPFTVAFSAFGWLLLVSTAGLMLMPWQVHRRVAQRIVPQALRYLPLVAVASFLMGGFVLWSVMRGAGEALGGPS